MNYALAAQEQMQKDLGPSLGYWWKDEGQIEKLANSGLSPQLIEALIKEASKQKDRQEVMDDFDAAGRIMAHAYYDELCKVAEAKLEPVKLEDKKLSALKSLIKKGGASQSVGFFDAQNQFHNNIHSALAAIEKQIPDPQKRAAHIMQNFYAVQPDEPEHGPVMLALQKALSVNKV